MNLEQFVFFVNDEEESLETVEALHVHFLKVEVLVVAEDLLEYFVSDSVI